MKRTLAGGLAAATILLGSGLATGVATAAPAPAPANAQPVDATGSADIGVNALVVILRALGLNSMCSISANFAGCHGEIW